jgi:hypothetical protein
VGRETPFWRRFMPKESFCQDGLGTNKGKIEKKRGFFHRGGFIMDMHFENIVTPHNINFGMGRDGVPLLAGNDYVRAILILKTSLFEPFMHKNDLFTKTGSGQTWGTLKMQTVFLGAPRRELALRQHHRRGR